MFAVKPFSRSGVVMLVSNKQLFANVVALNSTSVFNFIKGFTFYIYKKYATQTSTIWFGKPQLLRFCISPRCFGFSGRVVKRLEMFCPITARILLIRLDAILRSINWVVFLLSNIKLLLKWFINVIFIELHSQCCVIWCEDYSIKACECLNVSKLWLSAKTKHSHLSLKVNCLYFFNVKSVFLPENS